MLKNIEKFYKKNLIAVKYLFDLDRIDENRSNGTESDEYCKEHRISLFDRDKHRQRLNQLRGLIKKDGFNRNAACVKIGICREKPNLRAIIDGQHLIVIIGEMVRDGLMSLDDTINYQLIITDTYEELVKELRDANNSKPMDYRDKARLDAMCDTTSTSNDEDAFHVLIDVAEAEYYKVINRHIIEISVIGQHSSDDLYKRVPFEFWRQVLNSFKDLYDKADSKIETDACKKVHSSRYASSALSDLYKTILRTSVERFPKDEKDSAVEMGYKICGLLNDAVLGLNSRRSAYNCVDVETTFSQTQKNFKKYLLRLFDTSKISLFKGSAKCDEKMESIFNDSLNKWATTKA